MSIGRWFRRRRRRADIALDEIFLDSSNIPEFDQNRLEGKLERPLPRSAYSGLLIALLIMVTALAAQAANLTLIQGEKYAAQSERNRLRPEVIFAKRGAIVDRNGVSLAYNEPGDEGFPHRVYKTPGFSTLLGYVSYPKRDKAGNYYDTDIKGVAGIEERFNTELAGENGTLLVEEDALGKVQSQGSVKQPVDGQTLTLSIDARAQEALYGSIQELADRIPYRGGAGIIMDVETGQVIALVSYPEYDSNVLSRGEPRETIVEYNNSSRQPYLNRPVSGLYTPGSIVKPLLAAGALSDGIISESKAIVSTGRLVIPNPYNPDQPTIFNDWKAHGATDMRRAIAVSSDVYFYTIGGGFGDQKGMGIAGLEKWYKAFGYTTATGIELSGEETGFIPTPAWKEERYGEEWRIGNTYHTAIGQYAVQVTPIEAVRSIAAIANGGKLIKPTLLKDGAISGQSIAISAHALQVAREGMRLGATEGTSAGLGALSFTTIAGKTGTAQLGVNNEWYNSWVVGFFPYEKPKYAFAVVMDRGPAGTSVGGVYVMYQTLTKLHQSAPEYFE